MAAAALGLCLQNLAPSVKRELYFPNTSSINPRIKTHWNDLEAVPAFPESTLGLGQWDVLIGWDCIFSLSTMGVGGWSWGHLHLNHTV